MLDDFLDETDEEGEELLLDFAFLVASMAAALEPIAPRAETALDEAGRETLVAVPLTSLSASSVGSRETNSFCSN